MFLLTRNAGLGAKLVKMFGGFSSSLNVLQIMLLNITEAKGCIFVSNKELEFDYVNNGCTTKIPRLIN